MAIPPDAVAMLGSGPINLIGMAELRFVKPKENSAKRVGIPLKGFDAGVCKYKLCPSDSPDLHGLLCRKALKDVYLAAVLLRVSAQIR
ncbi:hypothetical protein UF64_13965 [Thalassospira sp. HJ]|nr:hypothetical protein UF64_13965 [Thalassospira sp. HJ]